MRAVAILSLAVMLVGCKKADTPPVTDTTTPVAAEPVAPAPITLADVAGKWNVSVRGESSDSVLATYVLTATADTTGWSFVFPKGAPIAMRVASVAGDSVVTKAGPFNSAVRPGMKVSTHAVVRLQDGNMVGTTTAHYVTSKADSVATLRISATRAQ